MNRVLGYTAFGVFILAAGTFLMAKEAIDKLSAALDNVDLNDLEGIEFDKDWY